VPLPPVSGFHGAVEKVGDSWAGALFAIDTDRSP
jgi:hypothetical protein